MLNDKVSPLFKKYNTTAAGLALSYILSYPEVSTVIPGIRTPEHVQLNTNHLVVLEEKDKLFLQHLYETDWAAVLNLMEKQG